MKKLLKNPKFYIAILAIVVISIVILSKRSYVEYTIEV